MFHYYFGGGRAVTLDEIGYLRGIVEQYAYRDGAEGAFPRLSGQIADAARKQGTGPVAYDFRFTYDFGSVAFSHGDGTVKELFIGWAEDYGEIFRISGDISFEFTDDFVDPLDMNFEPGGTPYHISGRWRTSFSAEVLKDRKRSIYFDPKESR
ncbi:MULTISPECIES: hypothetical protein [Paracoccus]|uniref:Uncharacterized protein n=1 Tax=Paracoccus versutus TaxID=34007 RepID=A0A3D9XI37_PARVE|nr:MULTISPECIES: hypothetical protein [Paracoccus]REF70166.1 hypothetical protein BDD41_2888 [Paracoccus versutus]WGR57507.1 hypothetical protein E3U25_16135 [Paracoccus versutus]